MYRVRTWAHRTAQESRFNPWAQEASGEKDAVQQPTTLAADISAATETEQDKPVVKVPVARRVWLNVKRALFHSWINVLLVFVPAGIALHFAGINPNVVFAVNAIAIIPLAGLLTFATEAVAHRLGPTLGALLNVSFGNAVELIIFIIALVKNEIRVVQASLIGSILANLLLILGMAFLIGGLEYQEQVYDATVTQMSACFLALSVLSLLMPTAFHVSFQDLDAADKAVLKVSRGTSVILLVMYVLYLLFQLKSHAYLYQGTPQHIINAQSEPGFLARFDTASSSDSNSTSRSSISSKASGSHHHIRKRLRSKLGRKRKSKTETVDESNDSVSTPEKVAPLAMVDSLSLVSPRTTGSTTLASPDAITIVATEPDTPEVDYDQSIVENLSKTISAPPARPPVRPALGPTRPTLRSAWSIRPPPVFRMQTNTDWANMTSTSVAQHQLRRMRSAPMVPRQVQFSPAQSALQLQVTNAEAAPTSEEPPISQTAAIVLLLCSTALVAICAEFLVGSIEHLVESSSISEAFIGLIILPIVGNAAEHVTAVTVAAKNKLDLSLGVSLGSSIQIAIFVTPVVVILGWIMDKDMSLYFNLFETAALFVAAFIVNFLVLDGRSNYLEGALLCACYVIIAVGAFFFPDNQSQSSLTKGSGSGSG